MIDFMYIRRDKAQATVENQEKYVIALLFYKCQNDSKKGDESMNIGDNIKYLRTAAGLTQEQLANSLGVSFQAISKWETDETVPDIYQSKKLAKLYHLSLDELIEFDVDLKEIEHIIKNTDEKKEAKVDWTNAWSRKYPVLATYQQVVNIDGYASVIRKMLEQLKMDYGYNGLDSMLVLKDILYHEWKDHK